VVYDANRTVGLLADPLDTSPNAVGTHDGFPDHSRIHLRGFHLWSSSYFPRVLNWARDKFLDHLAKEQNPDRAAEVLRDAPDFFQHLKLPNDKDFWKVTLYKAGIDYPEKFPSGTPLFEAYVDFRLGENVYCWPRDWVNEELVHYAEQLIPPTEAWINPRN
jgi:hypothetical protein